ncbi:MAG: hypothetical protein ACI8PZ_006677 [Myxococcota bacterium]|jgi:hypothetical protein
MRAALRGCCAVSGCALPVLDAVLASPVWEPPRMAATSSAMRRYGLDDDRALWERLLAVPEPEPEPEPPPRSWWQLWRR